MVLPGPAPPGRGWWKRVLPPARFVPGGSVPSAAAAGEGGEPGESEMRRNGLLIFLLSMVVAICTTFVVVKRESEARPGRAESAVREGGGEDTIQVPGVPASVVR